MGEKPAILWVIAMVWYQTEKPWGAFGDLSQAPFNWVFLLVISECSDQRTLVRQTSTQINNVEPALERQTLLWYFTK